MDPPNHNRWGTKVNLPQRPIDRGWIHDSQCFIKDIGKNGTQHGFLLLLSRQTPTV